MDKRELQEKLISLKSEYKNAINGLPVAENLLPSQQVKAYVRNTANLLSM